MSAQRLKQLQVAFAIATSAGFAAYVWVGFVNYRRAVYVTGQEPLHWYWSALVAVVAFGCLFTLLGITAKRRKLEKAYPQRDSTP